MSQLLIIPEADDIEHSLELAEEFHCAFEYNDFFHPVMLDDREKQRERIALYRSVRKDFSKDTMHGAFLDVTVHSDDPKIREVSRLRIRQSMDIAQELGVKGVVFHTGRICGFRSEGYLKNWIEVNQSVFSGIHDEYPDTEIYMENMFDEAPDVLAQLALKMGPKERFGVCLDYAHASLTQVLPEEWFAQLAPYIRHMHINDNDLKNDLHLPLGEGKICWDICFRLLLDYHVRTSVLVEVSGVEKQRKSLQYIKECMRNQAEHGGAV